MSQKFGPGLNIKVFEKTVFNKERSVLELVIDLFGESFQNLYRIVIFEVKNS